jgi:hypothetical protein
MDGGLDVARPRAERGHSHGRTGRLAGLAPPHRLNHRLAKRVGHARRLLAGAELRYDGLRVDGRVDVLRWPGDAYRA